MMGFSDWSFLITLALLSFLGYALVGINNYLSAKLESIFDNKVSDKKGE